MSILGRIFQRAQPREALTPLYEAIVARARDPRWYLEGGVADTQDGRFDMIAAILALVLLRLERDGEAHSAESALLAELFIDDMDGQLRQLGVGDVIVGKHIGKMMGAVGGRLGSYRAALAGEDDLGEALVRNLYRGEQPDGTALAFAEARLRGFSDALGDADGRAILAGDLPELA